MLEGDGARHLRRVLRAEPGEVYEICDNQSVYLAEIEGFGKGQVVFRVSEKLKAEMPPVRLVLLASIIRLDRFEWAIEKATEIGVETIVPVCSARTEKGLEKAAAKRLERWRKIALESSQQARRARLPALQPPAAFPEALGAAGDLRYFLEEVAGAPPILSSLPEKGGRPAETVCLLTGPEGGWTDGERAAAKAAGWRPVSLGPLILRAETAAIAALAVLSNAWLVAEDRKAVKP